VISWDTKTWTDRQTFRRNAATVTALAFGNDETTIASAASDGSGLLWRIGTDRERFVLKHNLSGVLAITFTNNSLMAIHSDGGIDTWDLESGTQKKSVSADANRQRWLSPSGVMMVPSSLQLPATECLAPGTVLPVKSCKILKVMQQQLIQSPLAAMVVGSLPQRMTLQ